MKTKQQLALVGTAAPASSAVVASVESGVLPDGVTVTIEHITPEKAAEYLTRRDPNNRHMPQRIAQYARDQRNGNWRFTHQGIAFDANDMLIDGEHRLEACVRSGATLKTIVVRGLPPDSRHDIDGGKPRNLQQKLGTGHKMPDAKDVAAWANATARMVYPSMTAALNSRDVVAWTEANEPDLAFGRMLLGARGSVRRHVSKASVVAALVFAHRKHPDKIEEFARQLVHGTELVPGQPAHTLREYLLGNGSAARNDAADEKGRWTSLKVLRAAQLFCEGVPTGAKLQPGEEGLHYFIAAHDATSLLPPPVLNRLDSKDGDEWLRKVRSVATIREVVTLVMAHPDMVSPKEAPTWFARNRTKFPAVASLHPSNIRRQIAAAIDRFGPKTL